MQTRIAAFVGSLAGKVILALIALGAAWWLWSSLAGGKAARVEADLGREQTSAAIESGADAVDTVGGQQAAETETDRVTKENADAIRNAPGAAAPVDPALSDAARRGLCRRAAYRERPECLQYTAPR